MKTTETPRKTRLKLGMNQTQFWSRLGITQSGGSRYESHRTIPKPVQSLLTIAYGDDKECQAEINRLRKNVKSD